MSLTPQMLSSLLQGVAEVVTDATVTAMTLDSREVASGCLFVALKGAQKHGMAFAEAAQKQGAVAVIWEADASVSKPNLSIPCIEVAQLRESLGVIANRFYQAPSQSLNVIGITGTDGKTSVSHFVAQAMEKCAVIGTIGIGSLDNLQTATHTTPDVLSVHKNLAMLKQQGIQSVAMEVSSHALDQERVASVAFDVAVLTNLSRDHLDYHKTVAAYAEAKEKLFHGAGLKSIVINLDDEFGRKIANRATHHLIAYGADDATEYPSGSLLARNAQFTNDGIRADIQFGDHQGRLDVAVLGRFNLSNLLAALGAMLGLGLPFNEALSQINQVKTVAGRMEKVGASKGEALTVVDFAHTPNALESVLKALHEHLNHAENNKLICVFGCGGDRDAGKRPLMAAVAEQYADVVIVTDDNPRTENPENIIKDIMAGFAKPDQVTVQHDRAAAIRQALQQANQADVVLIAGKGHESGQILATGTVPFNDREQVEQAMQELAA